ncbi:acyl-[acyl-carrier-protein] thioesterase [Eubacterium xylanophilum]|uniref:acyl-[acyl-carrier-protein] thioesterase n=1 Tax=Eubacterium xylanophilum TaxID=39497 RepID=UPI00047EE376|nr:acyl-ACP thioesterase domain-containing protein [Eubacterium xylanophilum]
MFKTDNYIGYSKVDTKGKLKIHELVNLFQDCSMKHTDSRGMKCMDLKSQHHAWFVYSWHIIIEDRPMVGDDVVVATWPYAFTGLYGMRNFTMENQEGKVIAYADTYWIYFDSSTNSVSCPSPEEIAKFDIDERYPMEKSSRKVKMPKEMDEVDSIKIREPLLDTNEHVNNAEYIKIAAGYIPVGLEIRELNVEYVNPAKLGHTVRIFYKEVEGKHFVKLVNMDGETYVNVKFTPVG